MARRAINFENKIERVWQWVFPTLLVAVAPVIAQYFIGFFNAGLTDYNHQSFISYVSPHGELLLVSVALVAESASEIWRRQITGWQKDSIGTFCMLFVIIATLVFGSLTVTHSNAIAISINSVRAFVIGVGLCVACKLAGRG